MDGLLSGLGLPPLGNSGDLPRSGNGCNSIEELMTQLHQIIASKCTETRAEHVSKSFEMRYNTVFYINDEPEVPEGADPADLPPPVTRTVNASDTVLNQPADDPVLQRAVAKHIIAAMGNVDGSTWTVRSVANNKNQGWTFTYLCRNSLQAWNRQNAKNPERPVIGAFSGVGGLDPINLSRPAFDCRGTLSIAFSKSSRAIVVKYEHTPLHKTVVELVNLLAPMPPPPVTNGTANMNKSSKAKRPPPAEGEEGSRKKRKRKSKAAEAGEDGQAPGTAENDIQAKESANADAAATAAQAPSLLNIPPQEAERRKGVAIALLNSKNIDPNTLSSEQFNIFANQAPHLQELSLDMLAKYGAERLRIVHPDETAASSSSTPAQQTTPANTTPSTSDTPSKKKRSRKRKSDAAISGEGDTATTAMTMQPAPKNRNRKTRGACDTCKQQKQKCTREHPNCSVCVNAGLACVYLPPKPRRKSANSSEVMDIEDSDVPGEAAERDQSNEGDQGDQEEQGDQGEQVEYPESQYPEPPAAPASAPMPIPAQVTPVPAPIIPAHAPTAPAPAPMDPDNDEFYPDPNILSGPIEMPAPQPTATNYFHAHNHGGLTFTLPADSEPAPAPQTNLTSALAFPTMTPSTQQNQGPESPVLSFSSSITAPSTTQTQAAQASQVTASQVAASQIARQATSRNSNRHSLPTSAHSSQQQRAEHAATQQGRSSNWNNMPNSPALPLNRTASPLLAHPPPARPSSRRSGADVQQDGIQHAEALARAAVQPQQRSQSSSATNSPYQSSAQRPTVRARSRQSQRPHIPPATQTPVPPPQIPTTTNTYNTPTTSSISSSIPSYDPYSRYNNTGNDQTSSRHVYEPNTASNSYSTSYGTSSSNSSNQWSTTPQARGSAQSNTSATANTSTSYNIPNPTSPSHSYGTRSAGHQAQNAYGQQQQQQSYASYSSSTQPSSATQNQNWYGFTSSNTNTNNSSYSSNSRSSGYGNSQTPGNTGYQTNRANMSAYGHNYGGTDDHEQSIYDLLRGSGTHH